ncbi:uncharacterized protein LOC124923611 [Impatiens glandulifera]|uniref:uncharacterized protein LOC124923611 n=1 Tax=Impatiens glandulifera TaxID=253017 RepID=UPI001FB13B0D|nr:uncharacterized protein LOC124923611 [Impatiens glandulifera]
MGSLENGTSLKRDSPFLRSSSPVGRNERHPFGQRPRSRSARWLLLKRIHYLHWICAVAVFFSFVVLLQMLLPGSGSDKSGVPWKVMNNDGWDSMFWDKIGEVDFGEDIKFEPSRLLNKLFQKESINEFNSSSLLRRGVRFGNRKPLLALIFGDLHIDSQQILTSTVSIALLEIGYEIEVYALENGPAYSVWRKVGARVNLIGTDSSMAQAIDWLKYDGVIVTSVGAMEVFSSLLQEPFKNVPLVWTIHDNILADYLKTCVSNNQADIINEWKRFFNRANVIVFPNYALPMFYSAFDAGNYFVIPGSPAVAWEADTILATYIDDNPRAEMGYGLDDFIIVIVGSKFLYKSLWLEHALVLKALSPFSTDLLSDKSSNAQVKIIILAGDSASNYSMAVEAIALNLQFPRDNVKHVPDDEDSDRLLNLANLVIYGSFLEEQSFPEILIKAMYMGKPIIAPDLPMISKYVHDRVNSYLFRKDDINSLTRILREVISEGKLSPLARNIASVAREAAKNFMVSETIEGYAFLMEKILYLPSEVAACRPISEIPVKLKGEWQWYLFESTADKKTHLKTTVRSNQFLEKIVGQWNQTRSEVVSRVQVPPLNETLLYSIWEEEKYVEMVNTKKRREEEELKDRTDQPRGTWDEVYRSSKRADRTKNDLHERDDGELERTGQPLCIYEPFIGEGTWPFLHHSSLYRGIGLSTRGRRPGGDDIDAPSRLPLLNNPYYRDAFGDYGAFLAIANRVDHIHRNAWIGFQSWRATAQKESLSKAAETALLDAINARKHGDTLYFWVGLDKDPRNRLQQDFWSFCDAINAGNCKFVFLETLKRMYGIKTNFTSLPSMPADGDTWSVRHSWVLPTKSFLEFVMFSRMFVDALDAQMYIGQPKHGHCYLSIWKDKHCYSRVLELLVNVWAYHSGRHMVYVNPNTGAMQEQHALKNRRRGQMWVKWFEYTTLKSMDEDLAEEAESDHPSNEWLWPSTGEVFWQGMYEKERNQKNMEKEKKKKQSKDKLDRMRRKHHQKTIGGKYLKPSPEEEDLDSNSTTTTVLARRLR